MSPYYYRVHKKKKDGRKVIAGFLLLFCALILATAILVPNLIGKFGEQIHFYFIRLAGWPSLLIPLYLGWIGTQQFYAGKSYKAVLNSFLFFGVFLSLSSLFSFPNAVESGARGGAGGAVGDSVSLFLIQQFGGFLAFAFSFAALFVSSLVLVGISPLFVLVFLKEKIVQDIADWKKERNKIFERTTLQRNLEAAAPFPSFTAASRKNVRGTPEVSPDVGAPGAPTIETNDFLKKIKRGAEIAMRSLSKSTDKQISKVEPPSLKLFKEGGLPDGLPSQQLTRGEAATEDSNERSELSFGTQDHYKNYLMPDPNLLLVSEQVSQVIDKDGLYANGILLEQTLNQFHVKAKVIDIHPGPVITRYDLSPAPGVRVQAIESLTNDIALAMKAQSLRVLAPIPGKGAVGIEISNPQPATVYLKEIVCSSQFKNDSPSGSPSGSPPSFKSIREGGSPSSSAKQSPLGIDTLSERGSILPFAIGKTTEGEAFMGDMVSMPHLLIAGATGSGKSVSIHSLILSVLFRFRPDEVQLLLIDPKRLELPVYDGIPHLYNPACGSDEVKVLTEPKEVVRSLKSLVEVMEQRYRDFAKVGVRNIESYNEKSKEQKTNPDPYILVIIDELADLMIVVGKEIEDLIQRLAQMARAVGIHLVLATQRPSVDVITGVIKANLPSRIAFQVLSKTDSRVILDAGGAEDLLGRGDMLFLAAAAARPMRIQGAFVSETDVSRVVQFIKDQKFKPHYEAVQTGVMEESIVDNEENKKLVIRAARVVRDTEKVSGDLLRADKEIGSKYDLALTLLRKKGLIEKPKDTNRWKIHLERLNAFLEETEKGKDEGKG